MTVEDLRRDPQYENAKCPKGLLCHYRLVVSNESHVVDECQRCGRRLIYRVIDGRIDNAKYGRDHVRDILQYGSEAFFEIYGRKKRAELKKPKTREEIMEEVMDEIKTEKRTTFI